MFSVGRAAILTGAMSLRHDRPLYILPFDHRGSFQTGMFGWKGLLTADQSARIAAAKQVIYQGMKAAVAAGLPQDQAAILTDEQFGAPILADAKADGFTTAAPAERSGQREFDFEYGSEFARHIEAVDPTFCKVLVRYNPQGDSDLNARQAARLRQLSEYLHANSRRFLFELLVPAEKDQLDRVDGDQHAYDENVRPELQVRAIRELQDAGIEPDVWKVEGLVRREDCLAVVAAAQRNGRTGVGCIVLGHGAAKQNIVTWMSVAASVAGFIGFAVGRTTWWDPLVRWRDGHLTAEEASTAIANQYCEWVHIFESSRVRPSDQPTPTADAARRTQTNASRAGHSAEIGAGDPQV
jgi:myo-inositol catabolism protein IolC